MAKKKKKKQISKTQLAKQLKKAKVKKKELPDYKKEKDSSFRREARKEVLVPTTDLNTEIRQKPKSLKRMKSEVQAQKNLIKALEKENRKITRREKELREEYVFASERRKHEIEGILKSPDLKKKDLSNERNLLKALQGKDFDFIVDDGFKKYKISTKELKKQWKKGGDASLPILQNMKKNAQKTLKDLEKTIKKESKTASKARMKRLRRMRDGIKEKLEHTINKNIEAIETGNMKVLDQYNEQGQKAYSLLFKVVGNRIDRIGI